MESDQKVTVKFSSISMIIIVLASLFSLVTTGAGWWVLTASEHIGVRIFVSIAFMTVALGAIVISKRAQEYIGESNYNKAVCSYVVVLFITCISAVGTQRAFGTYMEGNIQQLRVAEGSQQTNAVQVAAARSAIESAKERQSDIRNAQTLAQETMNAEAATGRGPNWQQAQAEFNRLTTELEQASDRVVVAEERLAQLTAASAPVGLSEGAIVAASMPWWDALVARYIAAPLVDFFPMLMIALSGYRKRSAAAAVTHGDFQAFQARIEHLMLQASQAQLPPVMAQPHLPAPPPPPVAESPAVIEPTPTTEAKPVNSTPLPGALNGVGQIGRSRANGKRGPKPTPGTSSNPFSRAARAQGGTMNRIIREEPLRREKNDNGAGNA